MKSTPLAGLEVILTISTLEIHINAIVEKIAFEIMSTVLKLHQRPVGTWRHVTVGLLGQRGRVVIPLREQRENISDIGQLPLSFSGRGYSFEADGLFGRLIVNWIVSRMRSGRICWVLEHSYNEPISASSCKTMAVSCEANPRG